MITLSLAGNTTINDQYIGGQEGPYGNLDNFGRTGDRLPGLLNAEVDLGEDEVSNYATRWGCVALGPGRYKRVKTYSGSTATPARGVVAYFYGFDTDGSIIVTPDVPTNAIVMGIYQAAVTKGYYTWIQESGTAYVLFKSGGLTVASAVGLPCVAITGGVADTRAIATAATFGDMIILLGQLAETATTAAISRIFLKLGTTSYIP